MTTFWKSQEKHWCKLCKLFIDSKKASIRTHEQGKRHKELVQSQIEGQLKGKYHKNREERELADELANIDKLANEQYALDLAQSMGIAEPRKAAANYSEYTPGMGKESAERLAYQAAEKNIVNMYNSHYGHTHQENGDVEKEVEFPEQVSKLPPGIKLPPGMKGAKKPPPGVKAPPGVKQKGVTEDSSEASMENLVAKKEVEEVKPAVEVDEATGFGQWEAVASPMFTDAKIIRKRDKHKTSRSADAHSRGSLKRKLKTGGLGGGAAGERMDAEEDDADFTDGEEEAMKEDSERAKWGMSSIVAAGPGFSSGVGFAHNDDDSDTPKVTFKKKGKRARTNARRAANSN